MSNEQITWIDAHEAAVILRMTTRQVNRYGAEGRIRTRRAGRRVLYHSNDVRILADALQVDQRPATKSTALAPIQDLSAQLAERDRALAEAQQRLEEKIAEVPTRADLRQLLGEVLTERETLRKPEPRSPWPIIIAALLVVIVALLIYLVLIG